jgi:hypothetical protein
MRLSTPLLKLPIRFSVETLEDEVRSLPQSAWVPHATGFAGNVAVRLATVGGGETDAFEGPIRPTEHLARSPYIQQIMGELAGVWGRSRLMGLDPEAEVPPHVDVHYYWRTHLRIHIPVITNPAVTFTCGDTSVQMAAGECWVFDSFRWHDVQNRGSERRVHLVLDTVPTERLWDLVDAARSGSADPVLLEPGADKAAPLMFESLNAPKVMSPWEIRWHVGYLADHSAKGPALDHLLKRLDRFADGWAALWAQFGTADQGITAYSRFLAAAREELREDGEAVTLDNELSFFTALDQSVFVMALHPSVQSQLQAAAGQRREAY